MNEEKKPESDFHPKNTFKDRYTTGFGCVLMLAAFYGFVRPEPFGSGSAQLSGTVALIMGCIGFACLFMRDQIPEFIKNFMNRKNG
jgi:hypothetical protein